MAALGAFPLPVEVVAFGIGATRRAIEDVLAHADVLGRGMVLRQREGAPFGTDERAPDPGPCASTGSGTRRADAALKAVPGVVETGLFMRHVPTLLVLGHGDGRTEMRGRPRGPTGRGRG